MFRSCAGKERRTGNVSFENVYSVGMYCAMCVRGNWGYVCQGKLGLCVRRNWGYVGESKVLCQMHVAQLLMALCAKNVH
jgi:hypothetical protein